MVRIMHKDIGDILFSEETITARVRELGAEIASDYGDKNPLLVGVLKGSFIFMADLLRAIDAPVSVDFLAASSYGDKAFTSGKVDLTKAVPADTVKGRDVILVEDILDTGVTLKYLKEYMGTLGPASVKICVFLDKVTRRQVDVEADYVGFVCPDEFVVGYGLDYSERYRNLKYIGSLKPEVYS